MQGQEGSAVIPPTPDRCMSTQQKVTSDVLAQDVFKCLGEDTK